jgi:hypothetical protein
MRLLILRQGPWAAGPSGYVAVAGLGGGRQANPEATEAPAGKEPPWSLLPQQAGWGTQRFRAGEKGLRRVGRGGNGCSSAAVIETWVAPTAK